MIVATAGSMTLAIDRRVTIIPDKRSSLPPGTLAAILGPKQSGLGREGLAEMIERHGSR